MSKLDHRGHIRRAPSGQSALPFEAPQVITIVTQSDENYAQSLNTMLVSLFENNTSNIISVFVLIPQNMQECILEQIKKSVTVFSENVQFCPMDERFCMDLRVVNHLTSATYYKLFIADVLPTNIRRVIYLDSDVLVRANIGELMRYDLGNSVGAAVIDEYVSGTVGLKIKTKLGLDPDAPYFNSGVLVVDLDRWRQARVGMNAIRFVRMHSNRMTYHDQCALNWVLRDRWTCLPDCWNLQTDAVVTERRWGYMEYTDDARIMAQAAKIVHFTGPSKPWHYMNNHPLKHEYIIYRSRTSWKNYKYSDLSLRNAMRKNLYRFAPFVLSLHHMARVRFPVWRRLFTASS